ncbi:hypothetical protein D3C86_2162380 [compost metagenome]
MPPVAPRVDIAHVEALLDAERDIAKTAGNLARCESLAPPWALMVEEDAVAGIDAIGLAIIDRGPVREKFRHGIG